MSSQNGSVRFDVTALGELVIDLVPLPQAHGEKLFAAKPGGAPGNVAAGIARLGLAAAMLSRVGPGSLGDLLIGTLTRAGVETGAVQRSANEPTALAVVSLSDSGDRDFVLYREGCADANLRAADLSLEIVRSSRVLHVGSLSLATPVSAEAQRRAVACAKESSVLVSADVNFRPSLWRDPDAMRGTGLEAAANADIVKVSTEELFVLTGIADIAGAVQQLWHPGLKVVAVTKGEEGTELFTSAHHVTIPGFVVPVVDTVGCGDAFMASLLAGLLASNLATDETTLLRVGRHACAAGAVMAGVAGAMETMPRRSDIDALLAGRSASAGA